MKVVIFFFTYVGTLFPPHPRKKGRIDLTYLTQYFHHGKLDRKQMLMINKSEQSAVRLCYLVDILIITLNVLVLVFQPYHIRLQF